MTTRLVLDGPRDADEQRRGGDPLSSDHVLRGASFAAIALVVLLAGCGSAADEQERQEITSQEPLSRGPVAEPRMESSSLARVITRQQYIRATDRVIECARSKSVHLWKEDRYGQYVFASHSAAAGEALDKCEQGRDGRIRNQYERTYTDPHNEGVEVYYRCFEDSGLMDGGLERASTLAEALSELSQRTSDVEWSLVDRCLYDPLGHTWRP